MTEKYHVSSHIEALPADTMYRYGEKSLPDKTEGQTSFAPTYTSYADKAWKHHDQATHGI